MIIRDFNFAAFLIRNGFLYSTKKRKIDFEITKTEFFKQQHLFEESGLKRHHEIVKSLIASVSKDTR